jgi:hypothetical protein
MRQLSGGRAINRDGARTISCRCRIWLTASAQPLQSLRFCQKQVQQQHLYAFLQNTVVQACNHPRLPHSTANQTDKPPQATLRCRDYVALDFDATVVIATTLQLVTGWLGLCLRAQVEAAHALLLLAKIHSQFGSPFSALPPLLSCLLHAQHLDLAMLVAEAAVQLAILLLALLPPQRALFIDLLEVTPPPPLPVSFGISWGAACLSSRPLPPLPCFPSEGPVHQHSGAQVCALSRVWRFGGGMWPKVGTCCWPPPQGALQRNRRRL